MKTWIFGGVAAAALIALPAFAQMDGMHHKGPKGPETRAEVEARVKAHFADVDTNKDGAITKTEAEAFHAKMRAERHDRMFAMMDTDKNGQISRQEFDARHDGKGEAPHGYRHGMKGRNKGGMMRDAMFDRADADKDGRLTLSEANAHALARFDRADANKDGTITPEERRDAWKSMRDMRRGHDKDS